MKLPKIILGYAEYSNTEYPFVYQNGILNLLPSTKNEWNKEKVNLIKSMTEHSKFRMEHKWVSNVNIRGITNENKKIIFITEGLSSNDNGFIQFAIQLIYQYEYDLPDEDLINGLRIEADEINYFFCPSRVFKSEMVFGKKDRLEEITVKSGKRSNNVIHCGRYSYKDISVYISISAYSTYSFDSESPFSSQSQMSFEFSKKIDINKAVEILHHLRCFLMYICYRKNINFKSIYVFDRNKKGLKYNVGQIYLISEEIIEKSKERANQIITFELLEGKIAPIFQAISDKKLYLEHISECIDDKKSLNMAKIILLFTAFEREYKNTLSEKSIRSEQYNEVKTYVLKTLENIKKSCSSAKSRKYIKGFIKIIDNSDNSLRERIKYVLKSNIKVMSIFLKYYYQTDDMMLIEDISQRMNAIRNDIVHGNLNLTIEPIHIYDFNILEILIYVLRMTTLNMSMISIQKVICQLFSYNLYISDESNEENKA